MSTDVVCAGQLCLDIFQRFQNEPGVTVGELFRPGSVVSVSEMSFSVGGCVANTAGALALFGCDVKPVGRVGDDSIGSMLLELLTSRLDVSTIAIAAGEAGSYTVNLSPVGIERIFLYFPGPNRTFGSQDVKDSLLCDARLLHLGYPTYMERLYAHGGRELSAVLRTAKEAGATTSLDTAMADPGSPAARCDWRAIYAEALPFVDIFVPSIEEAFGALFPDDYRALRQMYPQEDLLPRFTPADFRRVSDSVLSAGCAICGLKAGANGWYLKCADVRRLGRMGRAAVSAPGDWAGREIWCPGFKADNIVSATGAGDVSVAAFLTGLLRGFGPVKCLKIANCAGWVSLQALDALGAVTNWEALEKTLPALTQREVRGLGQEDGWKWNEAEGVWEGRGGGN